MDELLVSPAEQQDTAIQRRDSPVAGHRRVWQRLLMVPGERTVGRAAVSFILLACAFLLMPLMSFQSLGAALGWWGLFAAAALLIGSASDGRVRRQRADRARLHLAAIVESSDDAIFAKSLDAIIQTWNAGAERIYGYTADEVIGRPVTMLAPPDHSDEILEIMRRLTAGEVVRHYETVRMKKDGTRFEVSLTISPVKDGSGRIIGASTVARDVTDRKRVERQQRLLAAIVESSEDAIYRKSLRGMIQSWNEAAARIYGYGADEVVGQPVTMLVPPERMADEREILTRLARGERVERYETERRRKDGSRFDAQLTISPIHDDQGRVVAASSSTQDITERKRAERRQRFLADASAALVRSLDVAPTIDALAHLAVPALADCCTVHLVEDDGSLRHIVTVHRDPAKAALARTWAEQRPSDPDAPYVLPHVIRTGTSLLYVDAGQALSPAGAPQDAELSGLMSSLGIRSVIIAPLMARGRTLGAITLMTAESDRRYDQADVALAEDLGQRVALAVDNAQLHEAQTEARRHAERAARRIAQLQAFTAALSESVTPADVAAVTLRHAVDEFGAGAAALTAADGRDERPKTIGVVGHSAALTERWWREPHRITALRDAMETAEVVWFPSWAAFKERYPALEPPRDPVLYGARAAVPLMLHGQAVGVLYMNFAEVRQFDADELRFMLTLGRQCAQAIERARLYAHEHQVAATLQQALLPTALPQIPGIDVDAVYRAGMPESDVGGDWYDALVLPDGRVMLTIGDVVGRGLRAAVTMGQIRQAVRAAALEGRAPAAVLALASRLLRAAVADQEMTTAILGVLDPVDSTFTYAAAGHPPPLLVVDGRAETLPSGGLPLGFLGENTAPQWTVQLPPGALLVLYTDGLTEARRDPEAGHVALEAAAARVWHDPDPRAAHALVDRIGLGTAPDDVAVVTVRLAATALDRLDMTVKAEPDSLAPVRQALRRLARASRLDDNRAFALAVAVGEAVNNAIEHAYGLTSGTVTVRAWRDADLLRVEVTDAGRWRDPVPGSRGGRGFDVMRAFVESLEIAPTAGGTRVSFTIALQDLHSTEHAAVPSFGRALVERPRADGPPRDALPIGTDDFAVRLQDGVPVVTIAGDVDLTNRDRFAGALDRAAAHGAGPVVLTWSRPGYFDSHGIRALLQAARRLTTVRRVLFLAVPLDWPLRRLLANAGVGGDVRLFESTEVAVAAALAWPMPSESRHRA
ncbi:MAG TPA: PAS domain S-box protein [bacterium]|nr:PAS domain S-box protein [bacterium]